MSTTPIGTFALVLRNGRILCFGDRDFLETESQYHEGSHVVPTVRALRIAAHNEELGNENQLAAI